jgi:hypothetical protein
MKTRTRRAVVLSTTFAVSLSAFCCAQTSSAPAAASKADSKSIPSIDGGIGPCSADFTITDAADAPVYAAKIKVHIAYGFGSFHKLDLEVGTNSDGKARFTGLPDQLKRGLFFEASEGDRAGSAFDDPVKTCTAQFTVVLRKKDS